MGVYGGVHYEYGEKGLCNDEAGMLSCDQVQALERNSREISVLDVHSLHLLLLQYLIHKLDEVHRLQRYVSISRNKKRWTNLLFAQPPSQPSPSACETESALEYPTTALFVRTIWDLTHETPTRYTVASIHHLPQSAL
jgi:hypothetical protein